MTEPDDVEPPDAVEPRDLGEWLTSHVRVRRSEYEEQYAELVGRFGWQRTEKWNELTPPVYVSLGTGFAF